jgi:hypothetical protein
VAVQVDAGVDGVCACVCVCVRVRICASISTYRETAAQECMVFVRVCGCVFACSLISLCMYAGKRPRRSGWRLRPFTLSGVLH